MTQLRTVSWDQERQRGRPESAAVEDRILFYEGDRIYLRPMELTDEQKLRKWINDPEIWRYLMVRTPMTSIREREWIESQGRSETEVRFGVVVRAGDRLIGSVGLHRIHPVNRNAEVGIMIGDREYHGKGFGTEAVRLIVRYGFEELNLHRVALRVFSNNYRAIGCYQKAGFVHEGCLREAMFRNGQFVDEYLFSIMRADWLAGRGAPAA